MRKSGGEWPKRGEKWRIGALFQKRSNGINNFLGSFGFGVLFGAGGLSGDWWLRSSSYAHVLHDGRMDGGLRISQMIDRKGFV